MIQKEFAKNVVDISTIDEEIVGVAAAGSWMTNELDVFSDLDLILITKTKISGDRSKMLAYAEKFGKLLNGFTGEHVGEPRVLICLYDDPLLHVDLKFLTIEEFQHRIEDPVVLLDKDGSLKKTIHANPGSYPAVDHQWIEDRFWIWVHYILLKIGRGELVEAFDCFSLLRMTIFGPLLHIRNGNLPRAVRKVETQLKQDDLNKLLKTIPTYSAESLLQTLQHSIALYHELRNEQMLNIEKRSQTEARVMEYFLDIIHLNR